ncbi:MAG TPA: GMC family oxidoreductase N-terminal domain-containing protein [Caulobacteraceae bacterium]|nr:GMC family oxidoreductase N-terminal domain-containing protein [Caulobacteraceae bacterium]
MTDFDYVIVGAGSAGCVLAYRLSENPATRVLLIEAGPRDDDPAIHRPKGYLTSHGDARITWRFPTDLGDGQWRGALIAGKTLGGTSAINSLLYVRGQAQDYDDWAANGAAGWAWRDIEPCFRAVEDYAAGSSGGHGGPLHVSAWTPHDALSDAIVAAGAEMGVEAKDDLNAGEPAGIGYFPVTIRDGRRVTAADAFLKPVRQRRNLTVLTDTAVRRIVFEGRRATGVVCAGPRGEETFAAHREVLVAAGALQSPKLLQLSGVGPAAHLNAHGVTVVHDSPGVGANLIERWSLRIQHRLTRRLGQNHQLRGAGLRISRLRYALGLGGIMATASTEIGGFVCARAGETRPDLELQVAGGSTAPDAARQFERAPGLRCVVSPLRPESRGAVFIRSPDPEAAPAVDLNVLATADDRRRLVDGAAFARKLLSQPALRPYLGAETTPGPDCRTPEDLIAHARRYGSPKSHFCGTCRLGADAAAPLDLRLKVRGVENLRVVDASVMPSLVSGNTNGAVIAMAWRAADLILEDAAV